MGLLKNRTGSPCMECINGYASRVSLVFPFLTSRLQHKRVNGSRAVTSSRRWALSDGHVFVEDIKGKAPVVAREPEVELQGGHGCNQPALGGCN